MRPFLRKLFCTFVIGALILTSGKVALILLKKRKQSSNIVECSDEQFVYMGPAQEQFGSLKELANSFFDEYWPNWNDYDEPKNYLIPPVFKYKHSEVCDAAFEIYKKEQLWRKSRNPPEIISDRISDEAEIIVYNAIQQLIRDDVKAPFIAIRGLNLYLNIKENKVHGPLTKVFPDLYWETFHDILGAANQEYDYVLIGPNVGIIVIEVKGSNFTQTKHFKNGHRYLPDGYKAGLEQLEAAQALIYLLNECSGFKPPRDCDWNWRCGCCVRKILFTPNLERERYDNWLESLTEVDRLNVKKKVGDATQWFNEDLVNFQAADKPLLYSTIRMFLENCSPISSEMYQAYAPLLAAMASITVFKSQINVVELNKLNFAEYEAVQMENSRIISQNPLQGQKKQKASCSHLQKAPKQTRNAAKVIFLSPDQQAALQGSCRQFILGAAGTGKTIVLQAKAIELQEKGEPVIVLASSSYAGNYQKLFDSYGFTKYKICYWAHEIAKEVCKAVEAIDHGSFTQSELMEFLKSNVEKQKMLDLRGLRGGLYLLYCSEHVLIDDACWEEYFLCSPHNLLNAPMRIMSLAERLYPKKVVWVAMDPNTDYSKIHATPEGLARYKSLVTRLLDERNCPGKNGRSFFSVAILKHVMRCSTSIFRAAYNSKTTWRRGLHPLLGHKIQGVSPTTIVENYSSYEEARLQLWERVKKVLLFYRRAQFSNVGVIVAGELQIIFREYCSELLITQERQQASWSELLAANLFPKPRVLNSTPRMAIGDWYAVSSAEFPVVIYASCLPTNALPFKNEDIMYQKYRALSRATVKAYDITMTYDLFDEKHEQFLQIYANDIPAFEYSQKGRGIQWKYKRFASGVAGAGSLNNRTRLSSLDSKRLAFGRIRKRSNTKKTFPLQVDYFFLETK